MARRTEGRAPPLSTRREHLLFTTLAGQELAAVLALLMTSASFEGSMFNIVLMIYIILLFLISSGQSLPLAKFPMSLQLKRDRFFSAPTSSATSSYVAVSHELSHLNRFLNKSTAKRHCESCAWPGRRETGLSLLLFQT